MNRCVRCGRTLELTGEVNGICYVCQTEISQFNQQQEFSVASDAIKVKTFTIGDKIGPWTVVVASESLFAFEHDTYTDWNGKPYTMYINREGIELHEESVGWDQIEIAAEVKKIFDGGML